MTFPDAFTDLDLTDDELGELCEVLDEVQAEEAAGMLGPDGGEDYGPWDDSAQLSNDGVRRHRAGRRYRAG
jgi:hypothetical protein